LPNLDHLCYFNRTEGLGFLLHTLVKLNLRIPEAEIVKDKIILEHIIPEFLKGKYINRTHLLNYLWCLSCESRFDKKYWPKEIINAFAV